MLVLTLLAYGCPVAAIVAAFMLDERTVLAWQSKAGTHAEQVQAAVVCNGKRSKTPGRSVRVGASTVRRSPSFFGKLPQHDTGFQHGHDRRTG
jgi:hypothetical protein